MCAYIVASWRGEAGLVKSIFLNFLLAYVILVALGLVAVRDIFFWPYAVTFLLWLAWALVGMFRCGLHVLLDPQRDTLRRIVGALTIAFVIIVACLSLNDLYRLFIAGPKPKLPVQNMAAPDGGRAYRRLGIACGGGGGGTAGSGASG